MKVAGFDPQSIIACDSKGTLHRERHDIEEQQLEFEDKWRVCCETNPGVVRGGIEQALRGADVCIAFSRPGPGIIQPEWIKAMAPRPTVFACANPVPEIWPEEARKAGAAIVATGRGDFPNQLNNSLVFPAMFRGVLDIRARTISNGMCIAAAHELARCAEDSGMHPQKILPRMDDGAVVARVAASVAVQAQQEGLTPFSRTREELYVSALHTIAETRRTMNVLIEQGVLPARPQ